MSSLLNARILLFQEIKPQSFKRCVSKHIKQYPCDKKLLDLLSTHFDEVKHLKITNDVNLYKQYIPGRVESISMDTTITQKACSKNDYFMMIIQLYKQYFPRDDSMKTFYDNIEFIDNKSNSQYFISFHFIFVLKNPFIYFLNLDYLIIYLDTYRPFMNIKKFLDDFILQHQYLQLDELIHTQNEEGLSQLFYNIDLKFENHRIAKLNLEQTIHIRMESTFLKISFMDYLDYYFKSFPSLKMIKIHDGYSDKTILEPHQFTILPDPIPIQPKIMSKKINKTHFYPTFEFHIHQIPFWVQCHSFLIQSIDHKSNYYSHSHSILSNFYYPSSFFFQNFFIHDYSFHNNIYTNLNQDSFKIIYFDRHDKEILFKEKNYKQWIHHKEIQNFDYFKNLKSTDIYNFIIIENIIKNIIMDSLTSLSSFFNKSILLSILFKQLNFHDKTLFENIELLFNFIFKMNNSQSCFYSSFQYKFNKLYYNVENILSLPIMFSFPEYYLLDNKEIYDSFYLKSLDIFFKNIIIDYFSNLYNYHFTKLQYPSLSLSIFPLNDFIFYNDELKELYNITDLDEQYWNTEIIEEGFENVGILTECPVFYLKNNLLKEEKKETTIKDIYDFFKGIKQPINLDEKIEIENEKMEDEDNYSIEDENEDDKLEDEEVDYENFYFEKENN